MMISSAYKPLNKELKQQFIQQKIWSAGCPVLLERLSHVKFTYYALENWNPPTQGEMIVLDAVAPYVAKIFDALRADKFPLHSAKSVHYYGGNDEASMADNNSSAFNFRLISGTFKTSLHSYGIAMDINPLQNPFVKISEGNQTIQPLLGIDYINRSILRPGMINQHVVKIFKENGFNVWGGNWKNPIDYQHFEIPRALAELLVVMNPFEASDFFTIHVLCVQNHEDFNPPIYQ